MPAPEAIPKRTSRGEEELKTRKYGLPLSLRRILILVDDVSSVAKLKDKAYGLNGIESALDELTGSGFLEIGEDANGVYLKERAVALAVGILGEEGQRVVNKLRDAPDDPDGLRGVLKSAVKLVKLTIDEAKAEELKRKADEILG